MSMRQNLEKQTAAEHGSQARLKVLLYMARRPAGCTAEQISHGTQLPPDVCQYALDALCKDEPKLMRREGHGPQASYFAPVARYSDRLPPAIVPGLVPAATAGAQP